MLSRCFFFACLLPLTACLVGPLVPETKTFLSVPSRATIGVRTTVRASGSESSVGSCEKHHSDVADGRWDCSDYDELPATVESVECVPAEACDSIKVVGAEGSFIPRASEFDVRVVARVDDESVERREHVSASAPSLRLRSFESEVFVDTRLDVCVESEGGVTGTDITLELNGEQLRSMRRWDFLEPSAIHCATFHPTSRGVARARIVLRKPALEIGSMDFAVRSMEEVTSIEAIAWADDPAKPAVAYPRAQQTIVGVGLYARFAGRDEPSPVPARAITYRDEDIFLVALESDRTIVLPLLRRRPSKDARLEVRYGSGLAQTLKVPVVDGVWNDDDAR